MFELQLDLPPGPGRRAAVETGLRAAIRSGRLAAGAVLPSTRVLAVDLGVSRSTVVAVYEQLAAEGYLLAHPGSATRVADHQLEPDPSDESDHHPFGPRPRWDWRPGEPDIGAFPRREWQRSLRRVLADAPDRALGYPDPRGAAELRAAIAVYLARARTVHATAHSVRICSGITSSLGLIVDMLRSLGVTRIAVEDPMLSLHAIVLRRAGIDLVSVPVDEDGICVARLSETGVNAVLVTPANQFPLSVTMSATRRAELVAWARATGSWIIEDDYDGEFRYDRRPIGSLQGLAPDRVVYAGTSSKSLTPGLRLSWLVVPDWLRPHFDRHAGPRSGVPAIEQLALADFIERGALDRQIRIMRKRYQHRASALTDALASTNWLDVRPVHAGLHVTAMINRGDVAETDVIDRAQAASVGIFGLTTHHVGTAGRPGLVVGFSRPAEHEFAQSLERLVVALRG